MKNHDSVNSFGGTILVDNPRTPIPQLDWADYHELNKLTAFNEGAMRNVDRCACFHCGATFTPLEISHWIKEPDGSRTAVCPFCNVDALIYPTTKFSLSTALLTKLYQHWFSQEFQDKMRSRPWVPNYAKPNDYYHYGIPFLIREMPPDQPTLTSIDISDDWLAKKDREERKSAHLLPRARFQGGEIELDSFSTDDGGPIVYFKSKDQKLLPLDEDLHSYTLPSLFYIYGKALRAMRIDPDSYRLSLYLAREKEPLDNLHRRFQDTDFRKIRYSFLIKLSEARSALDEGSLKPSSCEQETDEMGFRFDLCTVSFCNSSPECGLTVFRDRDKRILPLEPAMGWSSNQLEYYLSTSKYQLLARISKTNQIAIIYLLDEEWDGGDFSPVESKDIGTFHSDIPRTVLDGTRLSHRICCAYTSLRDAKPNEQESTALEEMLATLSEILCRIGVESGPMTNASELRKHSAEIESFIRDHGYEFDSGINTWTPVWSGDCSCKQRTKLRFDWLRLLERRMESQK